MRYKPYINCIRSIDAYASESLGSNTRLRARWSMPKEGNVRGRLNLLAATVFATTFALAGLAFGAKHSPSQRQSTTTAQPQPRLSDADLLQLDRRIREIARDETTPSLAIARADAYRSERDADRIISYCSYGVAVWAAMATLILATLSGFGLVQL
jgi:hypothetical protein